jgi:hypothetical protein
MSAQPLPAEPIAAPAPVPTGTLCPMTGRTCDRVPQCVLHENTGRTYCWRWAEHALALAKHDQVCGCGRFPFCGTEVPK